MSRECKITNRKAQTGNKRSHAMNASKKRFELNLQKVTVIDANGKKHVLVGSSKGIKQEKIRISKIKSKTA